MGNAYSKNEERTSKQKARLRFRAGVNKVISQARFGLRKKRVEYKVGAHVEVQSAVRNSWQHAVVTKVFQGKGVYTVQYDDGSCDEFVNHKLLRRKKVVEHLLVGKTVKETLTVFKRYMQYRTPTSADLATRTMGPVLEFQ